MLVPFGNTIQIQENHCLPSSPNDDKQTQVAESVKPSAVTKEPRMAMERWQIWRWVLHLDVGAMLVLPRRLSNAFCR
jgi:hypothetical protein